MRRKKWAKNLTSIILETSFPLKGQPYVRHIKEYFFLLSAIWLKKITWATLPKFSVDAHYHCKKYQISYSKHKHDCIPSTASQSGALRVYLKQTNVRKIDFCNSLHNVFRRLLSELKMNFGIDVTIG